MSDTQLTRANSKLDEFVKTVKLNSAELGIVNMPATAADNKVMAQLEAAKLGGFIAKWMRSNKNQMKEITPQQLKELSMAVKIKQEIAEKAYGPTGSSDSGNSGGLDDESLAKETASFLKKLKKEQRKKESKVIDITPEIDAESTTEE